MSISWRPPTSTTDVHHCLARNWPRRQNTVSSTPTASTLPTRLLSASRSASPQRRTSSFTVCQSQPSSVATSSTDRPIRPTCVVTHLAARDVNNARVGAIIGSCSTNERTAQSEFGHVQRLFPTATAPAGRTPPDPPTPRSDTPWTTPGSHNPYRSGGVDGNGSPPQAVRPRPALLSLPGQRRPGLPATHTCA